MKTFKQFLEAKDEERKIYAEIIEHAPPWSPARAEQDYQIGDVTFSAKDGLGSVPNNQSVYYHGLVGIMKPSTFLNVSYKDSGTDSKYVFDIVKLIWKGYALGIPFFDVDFRESDGKIYAAKITGHEGRNRMRAFMEVEGDTPIPVHLFLRGGLRNRDITPEMLKMLERGVHGQEGNFVSRPFVELITKP